MNKIQSILGIKNDEIKPNVILCPFLPKPLKEALGISGNPEGRIYKTYNTPSSTIIVTGIGPLFVGDIVLMLKDTNCRNIFFIGACGLIKKTEKLDIGSICLVNKASNYESFTELLQSTKLKTSKELYPDKELNNLLLNNKSKINVESVSCASFGSIILEDIFHEDLLENAFEVIEMECAALFAAAKHANIAASALLYVTDIVNEKPFYQDIDTKDQFQINNAIKSIVNLIKSVY